MRGSEKRYLVGEARFVLLSTFQKQFALLLGMGP